MTQKVWWEIGKDLEGRMRYGAWQIKEIVGLTLQPMATEKEHFLMNFVTDIENPYGVCYDYIPIITNGSHGDMATRDSQGRQLQASTIQDIII